MISLYYDTIYPIRCNCLLINKNSEMNSRILCSNPIKYMVYFSTGDTLFSCGIQKHIDNISNYVNTTKKGYLYVLSGESTFSLKKEIPFTNENETMRYIKKQINMSYGHWRVMSEIPNNKDIIVLEMQNTLTEMKSHLLRSTISINNKQLMNTLTKQINTITYFEHLETHINLLFKINREFNEIYKKGFTYCLPMTVRRMFGESLETFECSICTEDISHTTGGGLPCGHTFHNDCITPWFRNKNTCPNCRSVIFTHNYKSVYNIPTIHPDTITTT
jgi:hypothetical protein